MKKYQCDLSVGDAYVQILAEEGKDAVVKQTMILSGNEHAALHVIVETIRCLSLGKLIDHHFNPTITLEDDGVIVKCKWQRSGKLSIIQEDVKQTFMHANTVEEALQRKRVFTCTKRVYRQVPRIRIATR